MVCVVFVYVGLCAWSTVGLVSAISDYRRVSQGHYALKVLHIDFVLAAV